MNVQADRSCYEMYGARDIAMAKKNCIHAVMKANRLDAIFFDGTSGAAIAAKPGYPMVIMPFSFVPPCLHIFS